LVIELFFDVRVDLIHELLVLWLISTVVSDLDTKLLKVVLAHSAKSVVLVELLILLGFHDKSVSGLFIEGALVGLDLLGDSVVVGADLNRGHGEDTVGIDAERVLESDSTSLAWVHNLHLELTKKLVVLHHLSLTLVDLALNDLLIVMGICESLFVLAWNLGISLNHDFHDSTLHLLTDGERGNIPNLDVFDSLVHLVILLFLVVLILVVLLDDWLGWWLWLFSLVVLNDWDHWWLFLLLLLLIRFWLPDVSKLFFFFLFLLFRLKDNLILVILINNCALDGSTHSDSLIWVDVVGEPLLANVLTDHALDFGDTG